MCLEKEVKMVGSRFDALKYISDQPEYGERWTKSTIAINPWRHLYIDKRSGHDK